MIDEQKKTQKKKECLYDIIVEQYVSGSKVIAEETMSVIGKYASRNKVLSNAIRKKETLVKALYNYEHDQIKYENHLKELIGCALDNRYTSVQREMSNFFYTLIGGVIGAGTTVALAGNIIESGDGIAVFLSGFGAAMGCAAGCASNGYVIRLREMGPTKRVKLLDEVIDLYNEMKNKI